MEQNKSPEETEYTLSVFSFSQVGEVQVSAKGSYVLLFLQVHCFVN